MNDEQLTIILDTFATGLLRVKIHKTVIFCRETGTLLHHLHCTSDTVHFISPLQPGFVHLPLASAKTGQCPVLSCRTDVQGNGAAGPLRLFFSMLLLNI